MEAIGLRHTHFFEQLATTDQDGLAWRVAHASLVVLRYVSDWMSSQAGGPANFARARSALSAVDDLPAGNLTRDVLRRVLDAMDGAPTGEVRLIAPELMACARELDLDAKWVLAIDVYDVVLEYVRAESHPEMVVDALLRRGHCLRELGEHADASESFAAAALLAERAGYAMGLFRAQIGEAKLIIARGNLSLADAMLERIAARARGLGLKWALSKAMHERAEIAHLRGDHHLAIRYAFNALRGSNEITERDRILGDLASYFYMLGARSVARDVYLILSSTSREQSQRWVETINLMQLAADDGLRSEFERYKQLLEHEELSASLRTEFLLHVGRCYQQFGDFNAARVWLDRALENAEAQSLNRLLFEIEEARGNNAARTSGAPTPSVELPHEIGVIAKRLRAMRELTAVRSD